MRATYYKVLAKHKTFAVHQCAIAHSLGNTALGNSND